MMKLTSIVLLGLFINTYCKKKNDPPVVTVPGTYTNIEARVITPGLNYPWEILWGPDNFIWMTERGGKISRVNPANGTVIPVHTITEVAVNGEGGLLGMVLHPDFGNNPYVYVAYNYNSGGYKEKVVRFSYNGTGLTNPLTIIENITAASIHNGCRLVISPDLKLFITTGDAANQPLAQNNASLNGKVLRLNLDGSVPTDNPFAGNPVWSTGHRNAQGLVFANNILYSSEHGPSNDDEVNIIEKGINYGWPNVHGFCDLPAEQTFCTANNVRVPLKSWTPTIAVCGLDFYSSDEIPQWKNSLLMCTLKDSKLVLLKLGADRRTITSDSTYYTNTYGRLRDICISPQGAVYICSSNGGNADRIVEIKKK
jgi:aldose sugar dehydrogenase